MSGDSNLDSIGAEEPKVLDLEGMLGRMGGKRDLAQRVAEIYLQMHPAQIEALRKVVQEGGDAGDLRLQAHTVKGGAGSVGGNALRSAALKMEARAREGKLEEARLVLGEIERESLRLQEALRLEFAAG
jgi:two-component system, sensor histidine kinase and response regulator